MQVTHTATVRSAIADAVCNSSTGQFGANGKLVLYTGTILTGTVSITNGTATVTGSGTSFTTALAVGQVVFFTNDTTSTPYKVLSIASNTSLTLTSNYTGTTLAGSNMESVPANAGSSLVSNTAAATITAVNFGAASSGVSTITSSTSDTNATGGTVRFGRGQNNSSTNIFQFIISPTGNGGDMTMNTVVVASGATVGLAGTNTYTAPV